MVQSRCGGTVSGIAAPARGTSPRQADRSLEMQSDGRPKLQGNAKATTRTLVAVLARDIHRRVIDQNPLRVFVKRVFYLLPTASAAARPRCPSLTARRAARCRNPQRFPFTSVLLSSCIFDDTEFVTVVPTSTSRVVVGCDVAAHVLLTFLRLCSHFTRVLDAGARRPVALFTRRLRYRRLDFLRHRA